MRDLIESWYLVILLSCYAMELFETVHMCPHCSALAQTSLGLFVRVHKVPLQRLPAVLVIFWLHLLAGLKTPLRHADHVSTKSLSINITGLGTDS